MDDDVFWINVCTFFNLMLIDVDLQDMVSMAGHFILTNVYNLIVLIYRTVLAAGRSLQMAPMVAMRLALGCIIWMKIFLVWLAPLLLGVFTKLAVRFSKLVLRGCLLAGKVVGSGLYVFGKKMTIWLRTCLQNCYSVE